MRLERLIATLMLVINRKRISATELADKMEVSVRTVYRDIDTLCQAGFPLVAYQGAGGGFEVMEGYRLDRNALTFDEIASVLSALKGMTTAIDDSRFGTTLEKYAGLLSDKEKEAARFWQDRLVIDMNPWGSDGTMKRKVALIREALQHSRIIRFSYTSVNGIATERDAEPMTLLLKGVSWYIYAYCMHRNDFRLFRLSRMSQLSFTESRFERREHAPVEEADWGRMWDNNTRPVTMVLRFAPEARARAEEYFGVERLQPQEDGSVIVTETYPEDEWVYGFLLGFGDRVEVLEPERLRLLIRDRARNIANLYGNDSEPFKP
ncbi:MAG: transcriptional regulator [Paenibacillus sp.]|jgi:predicted DNA-binding transcriptional regulator YafY|nr:transcriptional regulator [Paenibacillus sp.]